MSKKKTVDPFSAEAVELPTLQLLQLDKARRHAMHFHFNAQRHDWRIPFEVRLAVIKRANEHCEDCGRFFSAYGSGLQLHHITYERAYGHERPEDLRAICNDCHKLRYGRL